MSEIQHGAAARKGESSARIPEEDADLLTIGHVCGPERWADLATLSGPLLCFAYPPRVLHANSIVAARLAGVCTWCRKRPVSTEPRRGPKPRRYCDRCTKAARARCVEPRGHKWPKVSP